MLHVLGRMQPGGAEMRLLEVLRRLCPLEFHADVCALSGQEGLLDGSVRACGGAVVPLRLDAAFPGRFVTLLRRGAYDVVHSHVLHTSGVILALAAAAGVPVRIAHFRAMHDGRQSTVRRRLHRQTMLHLIDRFATRIVGCGEGAMDAIWRAGWRSDPRCLVIYNAVDARRFEDADCREETRACLGVPAACRLFLHVGNEVAEKNHRRVLAVFASIARRDPLAQLVLVGARTDSADGVCGTAIREIGVAKQVMPLGVRDDVPRLLSAADALLLPSRFEGLPGVVLEACAAGVPVLASDLPGVREIAARLELVRCLPLSAPDREWADEAVALPEQARRMGLRATASRRFRASVFHIDRAVEAHRSLWSSGRSVCAYT